MVALTAANVAVTQMDVGRKSITSKKKRFRVKIVFGDGALTYPALGVPMPAYGMFGMVRFLDGFENIEAASDDTNIYKYDFVNNKMRIWIPSTGVEMGAVAPAANRTIYADAIGW
jgi:hypothetical protein